MIHEVIVTTQNANGMVHIAPMGIVQLENTERLILPFSPSNTLNNIRQIRMAVINYCDDIRIFAGCLIGKHDWLLTKAVKIKGKYLTCTLAHEELKLLRIKEDKIRPKLYFKVVHTENHLPFQGFNRAQHAVIEAAILISRLQILPLATIEAQMQFLQIGLNKTAGKKELEAWGWLMDALNQHKQQCKKI